MRVCKPLHTGMHNLAYMCANFCIHTCTIKESYNKRKLMPHFNEHALELSIMELFHDVLLRDDIFLYLRNNKK